MRDDILFEQRGGLGLVTLNRAGALNALTLDMIRRLDERLQQWEQEPGVDAVLVRGAGGRAFCAGGDIRALYDARNDPGSRYGAVFYRDEYRLNRRIFRYPKPYIALMDGITMGGGVGVSVHGSHRVTTERTLFAMPETGIGFFPDVGGGYFLPRRPGGLGLYLGLTGARLGAADCRYAGIGTHHVEAAAGDALVTALAEADLSAGRAAVDAFLALRGAPTGDAALAAVRDAVDRCFAAGSVEAIVAALDGENTEWATKQRKILDTKSPTSLKLAFRQLAEGARLSMEEVLVMEYRLSQYCMSHHDFHEGVRAVIIDKDNAPRWRPATLGEVTNAEVARAFASLGTRDLRFDGPFPGDGER